MSRGRPHLLPPGVQPCALLQRLHGRLSASAALRPTLSIVFLTMGAVEWSILSTSATDPCSPSSSLHSRCPSCLPEKMHASAHAAISRKLLPRGSGHRQACGEPRL